MNSISFTLTTIDGDLTNRIGGRVRIHFDGNNLELRPTSGVEQPGFFRYIFGITPPALANILQLQAYVNAFNRNFTNIGAVGNLNATFSGTTVTITARTGQFSDILSSYDGDIIVISNFVADNGIPPLSATNTINDNGNCNVIGYTTNATNGVPPYSITVNNTLILSSWNGNNSNYTVSRGVTSNVVIRDSANSTVNFTVNTPRTLRAAEFKERITQRLLSADVFIQDVNPIPAIAPLEYALEDSLGNRTLYQRSNSFPQLVADTYTLFVRDRYNCEVSKTIVVRDLEDTTQEQFRYLKASAFNSIGYAEMVSFGERQKKNSLNTTSPIENYPIANTSLHNFTENDRPITQFKSSYPFHIVTLNHCDGTKTDQRFSQIQTNLGTLEKVDCVLFSLDSSRIGVYFDGGSQYEPFTNTVIDNSTYITTMPDWAQNIGQLVEIGSLGIKEIKGNAYDTELKRSYFIIDGTISGQTDDTAQARFNAQIYNLFQFTTDMRDIPERAYITIEAGYSFDQIEQTLFSEWVNRAIDDNEQLLIEWEGFKNIGDIVFTGSGFKGLMRIQGRIDEIPTGETETLEGEGDNVFPLIQDAGTSLIVTIPRMTKKLWDTFNKATTVSKAGVFKINNMELVRIKAIDYEKAGLTNYKNITAEFAFGGESTALKQDEIVLNPSTGVTGKGGTGLEQVAVFVWDERERLAINGTMIRIGDNLIVV